MIISHQSKIIFIHIQRTGGSSVINLLKRHLGQHLDIVAQHGNARSQEKQLLRDHRDYFTFAFIRNPWERLLSWYLLIYKENKNKLEEERLNFERFLELNLASAPDNLHFHYNQFDYISNENDELVTHKLYRFENYENEIETLQKDLNLPILEIQRMNVTFNKNYRDYYTERSKYLISKKCKKDIDYFDYSF